MIIYVTFKVFFYNYNLHNKNIKQTKLNKMLLLNINYQIIIYEGKTRKQFMNFKYLFL